MEAEKNEGYVNLNNCFYELPSGATIEAWLEIGKTVLKNGVETTVEDTFYAGIFTLEEDGSYMLNEIIELSQNDVVTVPVHLGGPEGMDPITYYVFETDAEGNLVDPDGFAYIVSGEGSAELKIGQLSGRVNIVNEVKEKAVTLTPTPEATPTPGATPETGDNTPIGMYLWLMIAALGAAGGSVSKKRKQR